MQWFGQAFGAPYERDSKQIATPVGDTCGWCDEPIVAGDCGITMPMLCEDVGMMPFHYACHLRGIIGGVNHLRGLCTCCGGKLDPDPEGMTRREAAHAAIDEWMRQRKQQS